MTDDQVDLLGAFAEGSIVVKWDAARRMMAAKKLISLAENPQIQKGFVALGESAKHAEGLARLLAIDLIVRVSRLVKGLRDNADAMLAEALVFPIPPISMVSDASGLPDEAKPAEIRENVVLALERASGEWVVPYAISALFEEDKSDRCRVELVRQLAAREPQVDRWFSNLTSRLPKNGSPTIGANRLKNIAAAFSEVVRDRRSSLKANIAVGIELARLCRTLVQITPRTALPPRVEKAAIQVARLLDDLLAIRVDLIPEPDSYAPLEVFQRWWAPLPYPGELSAACQPLASKLVGAITLRARMGQRSESLTSRLAQAVGNTQPIAPLLVSIAESESGLAPDIDDWLRGRTRKTSATTEALTRALAGVAIEDIVAAVALMLLEANLAEQQLADGNTWDEALPRLIGQVRVLASDLMLEIVGNVGETMDFAPAAHRTVTDTLPREHRVRVIRPMVIRRRADGSIDVIEKAVVKE